MVIALASVAPEDAASNLSKWVSAIGFERVPTWLAERSADVSAVIISVICIVVYFVWLYYYLRRRWG
jgi:hypothetical protein